MNLELILMLSQLEEFSIHTGMGNALAATYFFSSVGNATANPTGVYGEPTIVTPFRSNPTHAPNASVSVSTSIGKARFPATSRLVRDGNLPLIGR